jgi:hypothetical protein
MAKIYFLFLLLLAATLASASYGQKKKRHSLCDNVLSNPGKQTKWRLKTPSVEKWMLSFGQWPGNLPDQFRSNPIFTDFKNANPQKNELYIESNDRRMIDNFFLYQWERLNKVTDQERTLMLGVELTKISSGQERKILTPFAAHATLEAISYYNLREYKHGVIKRTPKAKELPAEEQKKLDQFLEGLDFSFLATVYAICCVRFASPGPIFTKNF